MNDNGTQNVKCYNSFSQLLKAKTKEFIENSHPDTEDNLANELLAFLFNEINAENAAFGSKFKAPMDIPIICCAMLIVARDDVALVAPGDKSQLNKKPNFTMAQREKLPIGIYQSTGDNRGIWEITNTPSGAFGSLVKLYKPSATRKEIAEIFDYVKENAKIVTKCTDPHYTAVNNGIYDVKNKILFPFDKDTVFTSKIQTDLNDSATNPFIKIDEDGSVWDFEGWLKTLGDPEFVLLLLEVVQAACLPLAPRNKMVLFYSTVGNNGKGTICQLIRNLIGEEVAVSIPFDEFSSPFGLASLPQATAIITDENNVSSFTKGLANLKAVITGDKVSIQKKYENKYDYTFNGLVLQCVNDLPRVDDKTGSFNRRLHIIPFSKCFTGTEKKYIKDRLIYRQDVLEYVLKKVLVDMPYRDSFTETALTKGALQEYMLYTNSVHSFLEEILPQCTWDLLPATDFLYEMYKAWYRKTVPSGNSIGRNDFISSLKDYVNTALRDNPYFEWEWTDDTRSNRYLNPAVWEPLLLEYRITTMISEYQISCGHAYADKVKPKYSGLKRRNVSPQGTVIAKKDN